MRSTIQSLLLTDFRSYARAELMVGGWSVFLFGPNGAGKTNLLEAISLLSPGRGLRGIVSRRGRQAPSRRGRRTTVGGVGAPSASSGRAMSGSARAPTSPGASRRASASTANPRLPDAWPTTCGRLWLTPAQDRLFLDAASERRRFFDRLVFAAYPRTPPTSSPMSARCASVAACWRTRAPTTPGYRRWRPEWPRPGSSDGGRSDSGARRSS